MSICCACGCESEDTRKIQFNRTDYYFCPECDNSDNIVKDCDGYEAPRNVVTLITRYDGEFAGSRSHNGLIFFEESESGDIFTCDECGGDFYGYPITPEDSESSYCRYCANEALYCDNGEWYVDEDNIPSNEDEEQTTSSGYQTFPRDDNEHFLSSPLVGIEFEHAPVRRGGSDTASKSLFEYIYSASITHGNPSALFTCHHDGSIAHISGYSYSEIVSSPASGDMLEKVIDEFYTPFGDGVFNPGPEHASCGFHVHVGSRFLNRFKVGRNSTEMTTEQQRVAVESLKLMNTICKEFVSSTRKSGGFCNGNPCVRDKNTELSGGQSMRRIYGSGGYPSIAIRTIGTVEYRLWPSSNSIRYTKARVELSQKLTKFMDEILLNDSNNFETNEDKLGKLRYVASLCNGIERPGVVTALRDMLYLSETACRSLEHMITRFNPFSFKKTAFKFTDIQLSVMQAEDSSANEDVVFPDGESSATHIGDTTVGLDASQPSETYLSFGESIKCYPPIHPDLVNIISTLAKGDA